MESLLRCCVATGGDDRSIADPFVNVGQESEDDCGSERSGAGGGAVERVEAARATHPRQGRCGDSSIILLQPPCAARVILKIDQPWCVCRESCQRGRQTSGGGARQPSGEADESVRVLLRALLSWTKVLASSKCLCSATLTAVDTLVPEAGQSGALRCAGDAPSGEPSDSADDQCGRYLSTSFVVQGESLRLPCGPTVELQQAPPPCGDVAVPFARRTALHPIATGLRRNGSWADDSLTNREKYLGRLATVASQIR